MNGPSQIEKSQLLVKIDQLRQEYEQREVAASERHQDEIVAVKQQAWTEANAHLQTTFKKHADGLLNSEDQEGPSASGKKRRRKSNNNSTAGRANIGTTPKPIVQDHPTYLGFTPVMFQSLN
ncbi:hypothetical protein V5O48_008503 [Marasmius crinis-equi]|uniref:Uncharacterized protein n=1 Tax=Marasmius crinis-equi TaxID=585013 RepID=A0ABR3FE64_9AGAR